MTAAYVMTDGALQEEVRKWKVEVKRCRERKKRPGIGAALFRERKMELDDAKGRLAYWQNRHKEGRG